MLVSEYSAVCVCLQTTLPELGQDAGSLRWKERTMDTSKQVVTSQIAAMNAATAQVVTLTAGQCTHTHTQTQITVYIFTLASVIFGGVSLSFGRSGKKLSIIWKQNNVAF